MARKFSKNALKMAERLGVDPTTVRNSISESSLLIAIAVQRVLDRILDDLQETSPSGSLMGYRAVVDPVGTAPIKLRRSGIVLGNFEWIVYVEASAHHQNLDLNIFDILDHGRKRIDDTGPHPLWGTNPTSDRNQSRTSGSRLGSGRFSVARQIDRKGAIRFEPRSRGQRVVTTERKALTFREGPIAKVDPGHLYQKAFKIAKTKLGGITDRRAWDLVYVPNREKWVK